MTSIDLLYDDVLLINSPLSLTFKLANVFSEDRNQKEYQHEMRKKRPETAWERGVVVKLISKTSSCIRSTE